MDTRTIFGTTEKSNFILNMPAKKLHKFVISLAIISLILITFGGMLGLIGGSVKYYPSIMINICGFVSILMYIICILKKDVTIKKNIPLYLAIAIIIMAAISAILAYDTSISVFGNQGRYEGLLAIISYMGIFLLGTCIAYKKDVYNLFAVMIVIAIVQCLVSLGQSSGVIFTNFADLDSVAIQNILLPEAFCGSPIFLGTLLSLVNGIALSAACYSTNKKVRIISYGAAVLICVTAFLCESLVPFIGIGLSFILVLTFVIIKEIKAKKLESNSETKLSINIKKMIAYAIVLAVTAVIFGICGEIGINDRGIAWQDSFYKNFISGQLTYKQKEFYPHTWKNTVDIITAHPLEGTGPDCLIYGQVTDGNIPGSTNTFDKPYNDYLYTAATRGIPSLLLLLALLVLSIRSMIKSIRSFFEDTTKWYNPALFVTLITYIVIMFFSASSILVAPFFWLLLGLSFNKKIN